MTQIWLEGVFVFLFGCFLPLALLRNSIIASYFAGRISEHGVAEPPALLLSVRLKCTDSLLFQGSFWTFKSSAWPCLLIFFRCTVCAVGLWKPFPCAFPGVSKMFVSKSSSGWSATAPFRHYSSSWESLTQGNFDKLLILTAHCGGLPLE